MIKFKEVKMPDNSWNFGKYLIYFFIFLGGLILILIINPFVIINAGDRGVILWFGAVEPRILEPGLHFKVPIAESVIPMEVKTQKYESSASAASKDLQVVTSKITLNYRLSPGGVSWIYQNIGLNYRERIIDPTIQESIKASTAKYTAEELITKRSQVRDDIKQTLSGKLKDLTEGNIMIEEMNIVDFDFSQQFNKAIEEKVTAEQLALKAQRDLERIKIEAQQKIAVAEGEAESIRIINEQLQRSPSYLQWQAIQKWDGKLPLATNGAVPFINISTR